VSVLCLRECQISLDFMPTTASPLTGKPGETAPKAARASPWKRSDERVRERELKREAVLRMAAQVFNEKGFHAASLDEVADRLHISRPTLYYYFRNKDEILFECMRLALERLRTAVAESERAGGSAIDKLGACLRAYALTVTEDFGRCLIRVGEEPLGPADRSRLRALKSEIDREFRRLVEQGVDEGTFCAPDPRLAAFALAGALSWIARWYRADGPLSAEDIADRCVAMLMYGLLARPAAAAPAPSGSRSPRTAGGRKATDK
jgi:AcrR family transcriptional regulator